MPQRAVLDESNLARSLSPGYNFMEPSSTGVPPVLTDQREARAALDPKAQIEQQFEQSSIR